jgi:molecular chaperone GrpE
MSFFQRPMKKNEPQADDAADERDNAAPQPGSAEELAQALADAIRERDENLARFQRAQADFQNLRRRTQSDIDAAVRRSQQALLEGLLLALDQLELALATPRESEEAAQVARGIEMTRAHLLNTLAQAGVAPMSELVPGARFDPTRHEAVASLPSADMEPGSVIEVVRTGYAWVDVVLRPAQVLVSAAKPTAPSAPEDA